MNTHCLKVAELSEKFTELLSCVSFGNALVTSVPIEGAYEIEFAGSDCSK